MRLLSRMAPRTLLQMRSWRGTRFFVTEVEPEEAAAEEEPPVIVKQLTFPELLEDVAATGGRSALASRLDDVLNLQNQAESQISSLDLPQLCKLCRVLTASCILPDEKLLKETVEKVYKKLGDPVIAAAAAQLALAVCEANDQSGLAPRLVEALLAAGAASGGRFALLSGDGAAALALAVASCKKAEVSVLEALIACCSAKEMDLTAVSLADLRLAAHLTPPDTLRSLDMRATSFLNTLCADVMLDDPRGIPPAAFNFKDALTAFELELSEALVACEVPHSQGILIGGAFFPLSSHALKTVFCAEDVTSCAAFRNASATQTAWQRWRYQAGIGQGWRVQKVTEAQWQQLQHTEDRVLFVRQLLLKPPVTLE